MAKRRKKKFRLNPRFFLIIGGLLVVAAGAFLILKFTGKTGTITFGNIDSTLKVSGTVIRDESVVSTDKFEKISFNVIEGQNIANNTLIATVFKQGYQDESMVAYLNLQKEIYAHQKMLLGREDATLNEYEEKILAVENIIRDIARGTSDSDLLTQEQQLKYLQQDRIDYLRNIVPVDTELNNLYTQLQDQENSIRNWTRDIINTAGDGIVSFYFDGYENVLSSSKLGTINVSLVNSVVRGSNTTKTVESSSETQLYRLVKPNHWYVAFVTDIDSPMRVVEGETYFVNFSDYSENLYQGVARAPIVFSIADEESSSAQGVVNVLEFQVDIGSFVGIRTVNMLISKSAQGMMVSNDLIAFNEGIPCVYLQNGDSVMQVNIDVLASDEDNSIIQDASGMGTLVQGQKLVKP